MFTVDRAQVRVLFVDQNVEIAELYRDLFEVYGCTVELAQNGTDAVLKAEMFSPHAVYMPLVLVDMSGHELARQLRKTTGTDIAMLVALTGQPRYMIEEGVLAAGFNRCLIKPVPLRQLFLSLAGIVGLVADQAVSAVLQQAQPSVESMAYIAFRNRVVGG